jgi:hypothetical protein
LGVLRRRIGNSEPLGEAFGVDATEQLHGDVDVSIGSARHDRRRKVVALDNSQSVTAPAKARTEMGLGPESYFVGVDSHEQQHIGSTITGAANSE